MQLHIKGLLRGEVTAAGKGLHVLAPMRTRILNAGVVVKIAAETD